MGPMSTVVSWSLILYLMAQAGWTVRGHLRGRGSGAAGAGRGTGRRARTPTTPGGALLESGITVLVALFFALVVRWGAVVPVWVWWLASVLVAGAAGASAYRAWQPEAQAAGS